MEVNPLDSVVTYNNAQYNLAILSSETGFENRNPVHPYIFEDSAAEGQTVYVIDTGVFVEHAEFEGVSDKNHPPSPYQFSLRRIIRHGYYPV